VPPSQKKSAKSTAQKLLEERFLEPFGDEITTPDEAAQKIGEPPSRDVSKIQKAFKKKSG